MDTIVTYALSIYFVAQFTRALPWPEPWKYVKPLGCHACMTGWSTIAHGVFVWWRSSDSTLEPIPMLAAAGMSFLAMTALDTFTARSWGPPPG